MPNIIYLPS